MITVRIVGPDIDAAIAESNVKILEQSEIALDAVALSTQSDAATNCPVSSGKVQKEEEKRGNYTHMRDDIKVYSAPLERQVGTNKHYGIYVNNGTYKMKARPFLTNAFEHNKDSLISKLEEINGNI